VTSLERLHQHAPLTLVRSAWCEPEAGRPNDWRQILAAEEGIRLEEEGQATITIEQGRQVLRPA
jgi:hypothetical protein